MKSIIRLRPYTPRISSLTVALVIKLGYSVEQELMFPKGTPDDEILRGLPQQPPSLMLIPFHAHTDTLGNSVDGLSLLVQIRRQRAAYAHCPVLMPVSQAAQGAYSLRAKQLGAIAVESCTIVKESELAELDRLVIQLQAQGF